jgi:hypothetical protein
MRVHMAAHEFGATDIGDSHGGPDFGMSPELDLPLPQAVGPTQQSFYPTESSSPPPSLAIPPLAGSEYMGAAPLFAEEHHHQPPRPDAPPAEKDGSGSNNTHSATSDSSNTPRGSATQASRPGPLRRNQRIYGDRERCVEPGCRNKIQVGRLDPLIRVEFFVRLRFYSLCRAHYEKRRSSRACEAPQVPPCTEPGRYRVRDSTGAYDMIFCSVPRSYHGLTGFCCSQLYVCATHNPNPPPSRICLGCRRPATRTPTL